MPFGLKNAPPTFQRLMKLALAGLDWESCLVYLDDILLFSPTFEDHLLLLKEVFKKLRCANLKLKPAKCDLFKKEVVYRGHLVSSNGVRPDPGNIEKVQNWRSPSNAAELRSFLGLALYYRRFCHEFAHKAAILYQLTERNVKWQWTQDHSKAFNELKEVLTNPPTLAFPDFNLPFSIHCDASKFAVGVILAQVQDNEEHVIAYGSKALSATQRNWDPYDREWWASVWGNVVLHELALKNGILCHR